MLALGEETLRDWALVTTPRVCKGPGARPKLTAE